MYFKDFKFKINSLYYDASDIYPLNSYTINSGTIKDVKIVDPGNGYTANVDRYFWFSNANDVNLKNIRLKLSANSSGIISSVFMDYNSGMSYLPFNESISNVFILEGNSGTLTALTSTTGSTTYYDSTNNLLVLSAQNGQSGGSTKTKLRLYFKNTYNLEFKIPTSTTLVTALDAVTSGYNTEPYYLNSFNINSTTDSIIKLVSNPIITQFKGYNIKIIRISDIENILPTEFEKRYKVITEIL